MRRRTFYAVAVVMLGAAGLLLGAGPATAQTNGSGSSIGPCTPSSNTVNLGTFNVGDTLRPHLVPICLFDAGTSVTVTVNGQSVGTKAADASGGVTTSITISSATQLSIDDQVLVPAKCGENNVSATGTSSAAKANVTVTGLFNIACDAAPAAVVSKGGLAFTGADIARLAALALTLVIVGFVIVGIVRRRRDSEAAA